MLGWGKERLVRRSLCLLCGDDDHFDQSNSGGRRREHNRCVVRSTFRISQWNGYWGRGNVRGRR